MHLYNVTLSKPTGITCAVYGSFSAAKAQEIVVVRGAGTVLELLRPNEAGRLVPAATTDAFGCIRSLAAVRLTGAPTDRLVVGSDSGRLVVLELDARRQAWRKVHQETYGRSGCRRLVPGQYLAADPRGRAVMVGAVEKQKLVYVLNRDAQARLTISSPLEAHKSRSVTFCVAALDVGFDNPAFAAVELSYADADADPTGAAAAAAKKQLVYYELDLGLNHVSRRWASPVDNGANMLVPVPGGGDGPGGVLVCCENFLLYRHEGKPELRAVLPRRADLPADRGVLVVAAAAHRRRGHSFFLLQSEYGDLYKVTLVTGGAAGGAGAGGVGGPLGDVRDLVVRYFDSIPVSTSLAVMRTGFLFAAAEGGNHGLYQFVGTGDDDDGSGAAAAESRASTTRADAEGGYAPVFLHPWPLRNLALVDELPSLMPLVDMKVGLMAGGAGDASAGGGGLGSGNGGVGSGSGGAADAAGGAVPQLVVAHGQGARAALSLLRPGLAVTELAVSPLPAAPTSVFTARRSKTDAHDALIVVSFAAATLVFEVSGGEVRETADSGLLGTAATLAVQLLDDGSLLQVHSGGLRHVRPDRRANEWRAPGRRSVTRATANGRQAAVALSGGELVYFELDPAGQLLEMGKRDMEGDVSALAIAPVPEGRLRASFLAAGSYDAAVRLLALDDGSGGGGRGGGGGVGGADGAGVSLRTVATQAVGGVPESVHLMYSTVGGEDGLFGDGGPAAAGEGGGGAGGEAGGADTAPTGLFLLVGLGNGVLARTEVDGATGRLTDTRQRFLGTRAPRLAACLVRGRPAVLALGSRPWLGYSDAGRFALAPASYEALDHAAGFSSEQCPEGIVAVCRASLRILSVDNAGDAFCVSSCRLRYTPRRLALHPPTGTIVVAESEAGSLPLSERPEVLRRLFGAPEEEGAGNETMGEQQQQQQQQQQQAPLDLPAMVAAGVAPKPPDAFAAPLGVPPRGPEFDEDLAALEEQLGHPRAAHPARWASCVRVVDAATLATRCVVELGAALAVGGEGGAGGAGAAVGGGGKGGGGATEAITSMTLVTFSAAGGGAHAGDDAAAAGRANGNGGGGAAGPMPLLVVGTADALQFQPTTCAGGRLRVYRLLGPGGANGLELLHVTPCEGVPGALLPFRGRLLAGVGPAVRLYDLGKKRLLRKCEYRGLPRHVVSLQAVGGRVFAGDVQESVHVLRHRRSDNAFYRIADDTLPRYVTCSLALDYDTVATADKFGNVVVLRLPEEASAAVEDDPTLGRNAGAVAGGSGGGGDGDGGGRGASGAAASASTAAARLGGAAYKLEAVASFHVGDTVTSLQRCALQPGGAEVLLYATLHGGLGALAPLGSREDADFFASLELHLRQQHPPLCGRDHMAYRSAYFPVRAVADGDLCAQFAAMPVAKQREVAAALERTPQEVMRKVEDARNRVL